jgi:hypothetical protein
MRTSPSIPYWCKKLTLVCGFVGNLLWRLPLVFEVPEALVCVEVNGRRVARFTTLRSRSVSSPSSKEPYRTNQSMMVASISPNNRGVSLSPKQPFRGKSSERLSESPNFKCSHRTKDAACKFRTDRSATASSSSYMIASSKLAASIGVMSGAPGPRGPVVRSRCFLS